MPDGGSPAPQPPPHYTTSGTSVPLVQQPTPPVQLMVPPAQPIQPAPMPQLYWSHFKSEFAGKPDKDAEAHLLRTSDWMDTHVFWEGVKFQQFCLTLEGEARLWYESLRPITLDQNGIQNQFWQQYSKIGNTREQLCHAWRFFHFNENTETLYTYVTCIRQVATLLGYGKPQVLGVFKNALSRRLYWVLFPIKDLRLAVETAKRIQIKEKIDRQLAS